MNNTTATLLQKIIDSKNAIITSLKNKGVTVDDNTKLDKIADIVTNSIISKENSIINFYDYNGTLLHSYTRDEALALSELPSLPDRTSEGLTCQGWNYVLNGYVNDDGTAVSGIIDVLNANDENFAIDVGAMYIPTDGATHINITMADKYRSKMPLMFAGDVTIDWGDGSIESVNHTDPTEVTHEYAIAPSYPAKYTIKLIVNSGTLTLGGGSSNYNICGSSGNSTKVYSSRIDSVFIGNGVTSIGDYAFSNCRSLTSIAIPNSVTSIGQYAFNGCYHIVSITIPNSVTSIGENAFNGCYSFTSITISNSVTSIGNYAFYNCYSLTSVTIPSSVTSINDLTFYNCYSLTSVTIPSSVTSIGVRAFFACYSIVSITIPDSVISIGDYAFSNCFSLTSVTIPNGVTSIGDSAFHYCYSLTSITIPDSVTSISGRAFYLCYSLASVMISDSVTSIGEYAFNSCYSITSITIPNSVTSISERAFNGCYSLTSIAIPSGVTNIGQYTFNSCHCIIKYDFSTHTAIPTLSHTNAFTGIASDAKIVVPDALYDDWIAATNWSTYASYIVKVSEYDEPQYVPPPHTIITYTDGNTTEIEVGDDDVLTQTLVRNASDYTTIQYVEIGKDVTSIGVDAFSGCSNLTSITIPSNVTTIENWVFEGCAGLTSITIPESVTSIGARAFSACSNLTSITIPSSVTSLGAAAFSWCISLTSITIPSGVTAIESSMFENCTSLTSITISEGVTTIEDGAFENCTSLTSVTIPSSVTSIWAAAFYYCSSLTSVTIPEGVTSIGRGAFWGCTSLTSVTIPSSVSSIEGWAFYNCSGLTSMDFSKHDTPPTLTDENAIPYDNTGFVIYVKPGTLSAWQNATNWSAMSSVFVENVPPHTIITYNDGTSPTEIEVGDDGILTYEMTKGAGKQVAINTTIQSVEIGSDVTSIGNSAFWSCSGLTSVTIPEGVTSIGSFAFRNCSSLTSVTIPSSVTSIENGVFFNCSGLTNIILENRTVEEAQSLIGTTNVIGYTGTVTYNSGTYNTVSDDAHSGGSGD